jgi:hypothetical protein
MRIIIDRFERDMAVCEKPDRTMISIPRGQLPPGVKEGDVLVINGDTLTLDATETARRKKVVEDRMKRLWK